jgi:3-methylcrotonyl-CoA carboxylase alpha subunit
MGAAAIKLASAIGYRGAGTVEFVLDASRPPATDSFYFMEMNTRLQVEHPVTEAITGIDLVEWQLRVASGEDLPLMQNEIARRGHAVEARIYAEDPAADFRPSMGRIVAASFPTRRDVRIDSGIETGTEVGPHYDSLLAKVIAVGSTRGQTIDRLAAALDEVRIAGPRTNLAFLSAVLRHPAYREDAVDTGFVERHLPDLSRTTFDAGTGAAVALEWARRAASHSIEEASGPWARTDGFETGGLPRTSRLDLTTEGEPTPAELRWSADGPSVASVGGMAPAEGRRGEVIWSDSGAFLLQDGRQTRLEFPDHLSRSVVEADGAGAIGAPMHGRIAAIAVSEGDIVEKGDLLFVLEAMKMEHGVLAPAGGIVAAVHAAPGSQVEQGTIIVELAPG